MAKKKQEELKSSVRKKLKQGKPFIVSLPGCGPRVVEATSNGDAWFKYKALMGIVATEHSPSIGRAPNDIEYDPETGIVQKEGAEEINDKDSDFEDLDSEDLDAEVPDVT